MFRPTFQAASLTALLAASATAQQVCPGDDALEPNNTCASAVAVSYGTTPNLAALFANTDHYEITIPANQSMTVMVLFSHASGDINAVLRSGCASILDMGASTNDNEVLTTTNSTASPVQVQLEVMLSNNAGVDCNAYELFISSAAPTVSFSGFNNSAVGLAQLDPTPEGKLKVSNLGSSGCDGVSVDLGDADGFVANLEPFDLAPSPGGGNTAGMRAWARPAQGLPPGEPVSMTLRAGPTETTATADFSSMGFTSYAVEVYDDGVFQGRISGISGGTGVSLGDDFGPCPEGMFLASIGIICASPLGNPTNCNGTFCFLTQACISVSAPTGGGGGGGMWVGNTLYFYPEGGGMGSTPTWETAEVFLAEPNGDGEVIVERELVRAFDHMLGALDNAELEPNASGGRLKVSNLGSSGCDGVSIANPGGGGGAGSVSIEMVPLQIPCALLTNESYGTVGGAEVSLGVLSYEDPMDGTPLSVRADHSSVGSQTSTVEIYDAGLLVVSASGLQGELAKCISFPSTCGTALDPNGIPCALGEWASPQQFEVQGIVYVGDELRVLAEGATAPSDITRFDLCGADIPEIQIVDVRSTEAPSDDPGTAFCFGDGSGTACPCGNTGPNQAGCMNSAGTGARLIASGNPSQANDTLHFRAEGVVPNSFGILVSADNQLNNATGVVAFDGLRCVGLNLLRHGPRASNASGDVDGWGPPNGPTSGIMAQGGFAPFQTRHFQLFYREVTGLGCNTGQNTSHAVSITFQP